MIYAELYQLIHSYVNSTTWHYKRQALNRPQKSVDPVNEKTRMEMSLAVANETNNITGEKCILGIVSAGIEID